MFLDDLNFLPEWNDKLLRPEKGEEWKQRPALMAAKALYMQWREVFGLVVAFADSLPEEKEETVSTQKLIFENAMVVAPKIMGAAGNTMYQIKMENAALIRFNCRQIMEQIGFAVLMGHAEEAHKDVIQESLDKFKDLFRQWVATFTKDEYEDEWGLF